MICSRAPTRISFAGGGTDIPEIAMYIDGCVTSVAISRYVFASLKPRRDKRTKICYIKMDGTQTMLDMPASRIIYDGRLDLIKSVVDELGHGSGFDIVVTSEVPEHSGLGASASAYAALIALFNAYDSLGMGKKDIAELAFRLETEKLKNRVGKQDQYAACFGGLNFIEFSKDMNVRISPIKSTEKTIQGLEKNLALFYIAKREKAAGDVISAQAKNFRDKKNAMRGFLMTKELGMRAKTSLEKNNLREFGKVMGLVWKYKKKFSPETTTPLIERMHKMALANGAYGGKISGAGSGGCGFWFCREGTKNKVIKSLETMRAKRLDFSFDYEGVKTWEI